MSVLLETSLGDIVIDLLWEKAPLASKNFIKLCKIKYYNGALFFDVQKSYLTRIMHEKKEPTSLNHILYGEQAKYFEDQVNPEARHDKFGTVSTANVGPNMNNSNFFMTLSDKNIESLNGKHTIFGIIAEGTEVLRKINEVYVDEQNRPYTNIRILHTLVLDDPFDDPPGLEIPENSPEINYDDTDRLDVNDKIDLIDGNGRTEEEIIDETKRHEAKTKAIVLEMLNDLPDAEIKPPDNILFVCKLNPLTEEDDLETIFSQFGPIKSCEIIRDWKTGASLQYAFIEFETEAACEEAFFKMENALIDERRIHVDFSQSVSKYWYKYKSGNPIAYDKGKGDGPGNQKHRGGPRLEIKGRHREDKGGYGIVIDEDDANREARRNKPHKQDQRRDYERVDRGDRGDKGDKSDRADRGDRVDKGDRGDRGRDRDDRGKVKERERDREREKDKEKEKKKEKAPERVRSKSRSRNRSGSRDRKRHQDSRSKVKRDKSRSRSRSRSARRDKKDRDDKRRDNDRHKSRDHRDDKQSSRKREEEQRRPDKKAGDKKKKASSSRSSSSSSRSSSSSSRSSS